MGTYLAQSGLARVRQRTDLTDNYDCGKRGSSLEFFGGAGVHLPTAWSIWLITYAFNSSFLCLPG